MFVLITCVFILFGLKERKFTILFSSSSRNLVSFPLSHFLFWANGDCFYFLFLSISWYTFHLHNLAGDLERWKKPQILLPCEIFMDALHLSLCLALFNFLPLIWSYVCSIRVPRITLPFSLLLIILAGSICLLCILSSIWWDWSFYFFFFLGWSCQTNISNGRDPMLWQNFPMLHMYSDLCKFCLFSQSSQVH